MQAGDLVFCHSAGIMGRAIRFAQRHDKDGVDAKWNHVAVLDRCLDGVWYVIQAEAHGVTADKALDSVAPGGSYEVVPFPLGADRAKFLQFVTDKVGRSYGFLTILSIAVNMYLPDFVVFRKSGTFICSGLVACGLSFAGYAPVVPFPDLYSATPADIVKAVQGA